MNVTSDRLRKLRMLQGYTKRRYRQRDGRLPRAVYAWEHDKLPEIPRLMHLARFYQVSVDYLLGLANTVC